MPKILVIADDFTGAAEIGGIAHLFGLSVRIMNEVSGPLKYEEDVIIIDTNTRRLDPEAASRKIIEILGNVDFFRIDLIYKKVDSILRGPVESEIKTLMTVANMDSAVLIPANPSKGRVIKNGKYFINEIPINQTDFINDPEYPRSSEDVKDLIIDATEILYVGDLTISDFTNKIVVPDLFALENFIPIISKIAERTCLPVGGADFFRAYLQQKLYLSEARNYSFTDPLGKKHFIIGSKSEKSRQTITDLAQQGYVCFALPEEALENDDIYLQWEDQIKSAQKDDQNILISRPDNPITNPIAIKNIINILAQAANVLIENCDLNDEIFIEGGETASTIFKNIEDSNLGIKEVIVDGVVKLELNRTALCLTVKPGSYSWPERIFNHKR